MQRRDFLSLLPAGLLAACASKRPDTQALHERQVATDAIRRVEIIYNAESDIAVVDGGGSAWMGAAGLLGPIGALLAFGAHAASKLTVADRIGTRTKEFTAAIQRSLPDQNLNAQCADRIMQMIRASGREVKVTPAARAAGSDRLIDSVVPGLKFDPEYAPLLLRITAAYGAESATSSYRPVIVVESVLRRVDGKLVHEDTVRTAGGDPSYLTYDALLRDHALAFDGLRQELLKSAEAAYSHHFDLFEPRAA